MISVCPSDDSLTFWGRQNVIKQSLVDSGIGLLLHFPFGYQIFIAFYRYPNLADSGIGLLLRFPIPEWIMWKSDFNVIPFTKNKKSRALESHGFSIAFGIDFGCILLLHGFCNTCSASVSMTIFIMFLVIPKLLWGASHWDARLLRIVMLYIANAAVSDVLSTRAILLYLPCCFLAPVASLPVWLRTSTCFKLDSSKQDP